MVRAKDDVNLDVVQARINLESDKFVRRRASRRVAAERLYQRDPVTTVCANEQWVAVFVLLVLWILRVRSKRSTEMRINVSPSVKVCAPRQSKCGGETGVREGTGPPSLREKTVRFVSHLSEVIRQRLIMSGDVELNPGPLDDVEHILSNVDDTTFREDDWNTVIVECSSLAADWENLSAHLGLASATIDTIKRSLRNASAQCCWNEVLKQWIKQNYNTEKYGLPSWRTLLVIVAKFNKLLFKRLAAEHCYKYVFKTPCASVPSETDIETKISEKHTQEIPKYNINETDVSEIAELRPLEKSAVDKLHSFAENVQVILQTVNDKETLAVLGIMKGPDGEDSKPVNFATVPFKFVLGMFGGYKSAQVKTGMGRSCDAVVKEALQVFPSARAIIMVGVAYGAPRIKAAYSDVLVSQFIHGVQDVKTTPGVYIARPCDTSTVKVHTDLSFTFSSVPHTWNKRFVCNKEDDPSKQRHAKVYCGGIISYPNLIADAEFRDKLSHNFPEAIGGEMEGVEVLKITEEHKKGCLGVVIIKGVADFADSEKQSGKEWQFTAAISAASYAHHKLEMTRGSLFAE